MCSRYGGRVKKGAEVIGGGLWPEVDEVTSQGETGGACQCIPADVVVLTLCTLGEGVEVGKDGLRVVTAVGDGGAAAIAANELPRRADDGDVLVGDGEYAGCGSVALRDGITTVGGPGNGVGTTGGIEGWEALWPPVRRSEDCDMGSENE